MLTLRMTFPPTTSHTCCCLQAIQPGALVVHSNGGEPQAMQMVASPKIATSQAQSTSSMTPQAAQRHPFAMALSACDSWLQRKLGFATFCMLALHNARAADL